MGSYIIGSPVVILEGPAKGQPGRLVSLEYDYMPVEYWDNEHVLEPGVYKRFSGVMIQAITGRTHIYPISDIKISKYTIKEEDPGFETHAQAFLGQLIPVCPLRCRQFFRGDIVKEHSYKGRFVIEDVNYNVLMFPGFYPDNSPVVTARNVDTEQLVGFNDINKLALIGAGEMRQSVARPGPRCDINDVVNKINAGLFKAVVPEPDLEIYNDKYVTALADMLDLGDEMVMYPFDRKSVRYVVFDLKGSGIPSSIITMMRESAKALNYA